MKAKANMQLATAFALWVAFIFSINPLAMILAEKVLNVDLVTEVYIDFFLTVALWSAVVGVVGVVGLVLHSLVTTPCSKEEDEETGHPTNPV